MKVAPGVERKQVAALVGRRAGRTGEGRRLRVSLGFSLREAAAVIGTDAASLSRWERGLVRPRATLGARYGDVLTSWMELIEVMGE